MSPYGRLCACKDPGGWRGRGSRTTCGSRSISIERLDQNTGPVPQPHWSFWSGPRGIQFHPLHGRTNIQGGWSGWDLMKKFSGVFSWFDLRCSFASFRRTLCYYPWISPSSVLIAILFQACSVYVPLLRFRMCDIGYPNIQRVSLYMRGGRSI